MGVEFTQSGDDIITREVEENILEDEFPNDECAGCYRQTELVCPSCLIPLCLECRPGHSKQACMKNQIDCDIVHDSPGHAYVSREDQDKFERLLTDPFGR